MVGRCGCFLGLRARPLGTDILLRCARELAAAGVQVDGVKRPLGPITGPQTDRLGAGHIARSVLAMTATATSKAKSGRGRDHRPLRVTPAVAVRAQIQAFDRAFESLLKKQITGLHHRPLPRLPAIPASGAKCTLGCSLQPPDPLEAGRSVAAHVGAGTSPGER